MDNLILEEVNHSLLLYAVQRQIFCKPCGSILDIHTAVLVTADDGSACICGRCWDLAENHALKKLGESANIIDGRLL